MVDETLPENMLQKLSDQTRCCTFSNPNGDVLILHEGELQSEIQWIEYDVSTNDFNLIHEEGSIQNLGTDINSQMTENLLKCEQVILICVIDQKPVSEQIVPMVVKRY